MPDTRKKDYNWQMPESNTWDSIKVACLMDVRDELKESNRLARANLDALNAVRHFFHDLGQHRLKLLVSEAHRTAARNLQRRRARRRLTRRAKGLRP